MPYIVRFFSLAYNSAEASMEKVTPSLVEAARTLGAGSGRILWQVQIPLISTGLAAGVILVFVDVLKELASHPAAAPRSAWIRWQSGASWPPPNRSGRWPPCPRSPFSSSACWPSSSSSEPENSCSDPTAHEHSRSQPSSPNATRTPKAPPFTASRFPCGRGDARAGRPQRVRQDHHPAADCRAGTPRKRLDCPQRHPWWPPIRSSSRPKSAAWAWCFKTMRSFRISPSSRTWPSGCADARARKRRQW